MKEGKNAALILAFSKAKKGKADDEEDGLDEGSPEDAKADSEGLEAAMEELIGAIKAGDAAAAAEAFKNAVTLASE